MTPDEAQNYKARIILGSLTEFPEHTIYTVEPE